MTCPWEPAGHGCFPQLGWDSYFLPASAAASWCPALNWVESGRGSQQSDQVTDKVVSLSHVSRESWFWQESTRHREAGILLGCHLPEGSSHGYTERSEAPLTSLVCALQRIQGRSSRKRERNKMLPVLGLFLGLL